MLSQRHVYWWQIQVLIYINKQNVLTKNNCYREKQKGFYTFDIDKHKNTNCRAPEFEFKLCILSDALGSTSITCLRKLCIRSKHKNKGLMYHIENMGFYGLDLYTKYILTPWLYTYMSSSMLITKKSNELWFKFRKNIFFLQTNQEHSQTYNFFLFFFLFSVMLVRGFAL